MQDTLAPRSARLCKTQHAVPDIADHVAVRQSCLYRHVPACRCDGSLLALAPMMGLVPLRPAGFASVLLLAALATGFACGSPRPGPSITDGAGAESSTTGDVGPGTSSESASSTVDEDGGSTGSSTSHDPSSTSDAGTSSSSTQGSSDDETSSDDGSDAEPSLDDELAEVLSMLDVPAVPLEPPPPVAPELFALGEALFFDPILSGNKDVACATCHDPRFGLSDGLSLTLGTGAVGMGPERAEGEHPPFIARHSQSLFNIGDPSFVRLFWDGRVERLASGELSTPAGDALLADLSGVLAAQALFPVLDRQEMRGQPGDITILGEVNELAMLDDADLRGIWSALMARLEAVDGYVELFAAAYPDVAPDELTFAHAANAIAAYETEAFSFPDSPWDAYLRGETDALTEAAKMGAIFFYTSAGCGRCHSGPLFTDHEFHNNGIVQLGPGQAATAPYDFGRFGVSGELDDRYRFRTPSLRNFAVAPPFMHNGSLLSVGRVTFHYRTPRLSAKTYDPTVLHPDLVETALVEDEQIDDLLATLDEDLSGSNGGSTMSNVMDFVEHLHDPAVASLPKLRPDAVPSGLDVP